MKKLIILIIALFFTTSVYALRLPNVGGYKTLRDYMSQPDEGEIENSRALDGIRKASANRKPWLVESLWDAETVPPALVPPDDCVGGDFFQQCAEGFKLTGWRCYAEIDGGWVEVEGGIWFL